MAALQYQYTSDSLLALANQYAQANNTPVTSDGPGGPSANIVPDGNGGWTTPQATQYTSLQQAMAAGAFKDDQTAALAANILTNPSQFGRGQLGQSVAFDGTTVTTSPTMGQSGSLDSFMNSPAFPIALATAGIGGLAAAGAGALDAGAVAGTGATGIDASTGLYAGESANATAGAPAWADAGGGAGAIDGINPDEVTPLTNPAVNPFDGITAPPAATGSAALNGLAAGADPATTIPGGVDSAAGGAGITNTAAATQESIASAGTSVAANGTSTGSSLLDWLSNNIGPTDIAKAGLQYLIGNQNSSNLNKILQSVQTQGSTGVDPSTRAPAQADVNSIIANQGNNAYTQNYLSQAQNLINANVAKTGNPTNVFANTIPQIMTAMDASQTNYLGTLSGIAGFNQNNSPATSGATALAPTLAASNTAQYQGLAAALGGLSGKAAPSFGQLFS